ncbi:MAG: hypothetical protein AAF772_13790 [Acidobacteriota bacterium]
MSEHRLYRKLYVFARTQDCLLRYCCFEDLQSNQFCVQNVDHLYPPFEKESVVERDIEILELLFEQAPSDRSPCWPTIQEAIARFEQDFRGD